MNSAREMIVAECGGEWNFVNAMIAAERVIEKLQQQIRDSEVTSQFGIGDSKVMMRERYRDRLDRMVAAVEIATSAGLPEDKVVERASFLISEVDDELGMIYGKEEKK